MLPKLPGNPALRWPTTDPLPAVVAHPPSSPVSHSQRGQWRPWHSCPLLLRLEAKLGLPRFTIRQQHESPHRAPAAVLLALGQATIPRSPVKVDQGPTAGPDRARGLRKASPAFGRPSTHTRTPFPGLTAPLGGAARVSRFKTVVTGR
jgi:hypothetical protein